MKIKDNFVLRDVCGENVIIAEGVENIDFSKIISLNDTAAFLWKKAKDKGEFTYDNLADELCAEYEVEKEQAEIDVRTVVDAWKKEGLVAE